MVNPLQEIEKMEDELRSAVIDRDLTRLGDLLDPGLIFADHEGRRLGKAEYLESYKSETVKVTHVVFSDRQIRLWADFAVVVVATELGGTING